MATLDDVRRLALALPEVEEGTSYSNRAWKVRGKAFVWERPLSRKDRHSLGEAAPDGPIVATVLADEGEKQALLASEPAVFTTPHFDGYPIVLVRLDDVARDVLEELVTDAWLAKAPRALAQAFAEQRS